MRAKLVKYLLKNKRSKYYKKFVGLDPIDPDTIVRSKKAENLKRVLARRNQYAQIARIMKVEGKKSAFEAREAAKQGFSTAKPVSKVTKKYWKQRRGEFLKKAANIHKGLKRRGLPTPKKSSRLFRYPYGGSYELDVTPKIRYRKESFDPERFKEFSREGWLGKTGVKRGKTKSSLFKNFNYSK